MFVWNTVYRLEYPVCFILLQRAFLFLISFHCCTYIVNHLSLFFSLFLWCASQCDHQLWTFVACPQFACKVPACVVMYVSWDSCLWQNLHPPIITSDWLGVNKSNISLYISVSGKPDFFLIFWTVNSVKQDLSNCTLFASTSSSQQHWRFIFWQSAFIKISSW